MKVCSKCLKNKSLCEFSPRADHPGKFMSRCKNCESERKRKYYQEEKLIKGYASSSRRGAKFSLIKIGRQATAKNYNHKRRAKTRSSVTAIQLKEWVDTQKKVCKWCDADCSKAYHLDHIHPLSKGGKHCLENLCISCPSCNSRKGSKLPSEWNTQLELERIKRGK